MQSTEPTFTQGEYDIFNDPNVLWGEEENFDLGWSPPGTVTISPGLTKLMSTAAAETLIVFTIQPKYCYGQPTDIDRLTLPKNLIANPTLLEKIRAYNETANINQRVSLYDDILSFIKSSSSEEETRAFVSSWRLLEHEGIRARFIELGFVPVYELDVLCWGEFTEKEVLSFAGTASSIQQLESKIAEDERYTLKLIGLSSFDSIGYNAESSTP